ncbi:MAG: hypothetical protein JWL94_2319 [Microbacteriaceae bacterium]|jgi:hypothetical protein|nr:hypothetical protein [Microbacteriaceae bacterium]
MELGLVIGVAGVLLVAIFLAVIAARARARRARQRTEHERQLAGQLLERQQTAGAALVRVDERVRLADDELGFAIAEFGDEAVAEFRAALQRARQRLSEAFQLNQALNDHLPDTQAQRREWIERMITLCQSAESSLDAQFAVFEARRAVARRAPSDIERARVAIGRAREELPAARATLTRLAERYSDAALLPISANPDQAEQLLEFAERSSQVAQSRLAASRDAEADRALRAATETALRAEALLDAVRAFEVEAIHAEATLGAMVAESHAELAQARALPAGERHGRVDGAIAGLERALNAMPALGDRVDPVGSLSALRLANSALDDAVAERTERAERQERLRTQLVTAIDDAERQIAAARQLITDYSAPIGPDARTRLAEAERGLTEITEEREPEPAIARARRAATLAAEAAVLARADLERTQSYVGPDYRRGGSGRGQDVFGAVLGGLAIGGLLDGLGDMSDFFD